MTDQEINEAVARKLGYANIKNGWHDKEGYPVGKPVDDYVHSIEAAWEIVEHLRKKGHEVNLFLKNTCQCDIDEGIVFVSDTAPMAIVQAFLKLPEEPKLYGVILNPNAGRIVGTTEPPEGK